MSADRLEPLPPRSLPDVELAGLRAPYEALIGFVPPPIMARTELGARGRRQPRAVGTAQTPRTPGWARRQEVPR